MKLRSIHITSDLKRQIHEAKSSDEFLQKKKLGEQNNGGNFSIDWEGILRSVIGYVCPMM